MTPANLRSFRSFWPYYLAEHRLPLCRALHYVGTLLATSFLIAVIAGEQWTLLWLLPILGYGPAWFAHFVIEKNRPATFRYPFWSLLADYKMLWYWLSGQIDEELQRQSHVLFQ